MVKDITRTTREERQATNQNTLQRFFEGEKNKYLLILLHKIKPFHCIEAIILHRYFLKSKIAKNKVKG